MRTNLAVYRTWNVEWTDLLLKQPKASLRYNQFFFLYVSSTSTSYLDGTRSTPSTDAMEDPVRSDGPVDASAPGRRRRGREWKPLVEGVQEAHQAGGSGVRGDGER